MKPLVILALVVLSACAGPPDPRPDRDMKPEGEGWYCSSEASGMLSVCERTRRSCKRAKKYLRGLSHRRGDQMTLGPCKKQRRAHCLTAERIVPKAPPPGADELETSEDEGSEDGEDLEESEDAAAEAEAAEADQADRTVVEDTLWLCYANRDDCDWQRKNMYYFGFTHVSRCGKWP